ncbi:MAG: Uncharacterized protein JWO58_2149 [Chitinophagaceae bacterium]|nr:Uncharacterized protein [Chitinophagaceae bacterium]
MIFLSASIPTPGKEKYFETADALAIHAAVRAVTQVVLPNNQLIWGGHPAITTMIRHTIGRMEVEVQDQLTLYQSDYFKTIFPRENIFFKQLITVPETPDKKISITNMRHKMIEQYPFKAAVFIGGMKGVEKEYEIFCKAHPHALLLPVASTGAAARIIYDTLPAPADKRLMEDYEYNSLFQSLLQEYL